MTILHEIPGARERPAGCRVRVARNEDGAIEIAIPPRGAPVMGFVASALLCFALLIVAYIGVMFFFYHTTVSWISQIAPGDFSPPLRRFEIWMEIGWAIMLTVGVLTVLTLVRPIFLRERLLLDRRRLLHEMHLFRPRVQHASARADVRGFRLDRDPHGLIGSVLTVETAGGDWIIAEQAGESEREWLASVGNALLRTM
jgi:hypothetical protein